MDQKQKYTYNDEGRLAEVNSSDGFGKAVKKIQYRFDEKGTVTETAVYDFVTGAEEREFYRYNEDGNLIRTTTYNVANKFDTIVNELIAMSEYVYEK